MNIEDTLENNILTFVTEKEKHLSIENFFNSLSLYNNLYKLGSKEWEKTIYEDKKIITFHNNILKCYKDFVYEAFIEKIRLILTNSKIEFYYMENREYRYNKSLEIVFIFKY